MSGPSRFAPPSWTRFDATSIDPDFKVAWLGYFNEPERAMSGSTGIGWGVFAGALLGAAATALSILAVWPG
jgi:hypothetical protein